MAKARNKSAKGGGGKRSRNKTGSTAAVAAGATPSPANDDSKRELFLHHRTAWNGWRAKVKAIEKIGDELKKTIKGDGFLVKEFQIADQLAEQRGEIKIKGEVAMRLRVARWIGHPMGNQLDLFASNAASNVVDPRDQGKQASMENQPRKPPDEYAPDSKAYAEWMAGYDEHQATLASGFKAPSENGSGGSPRAKWQQQLREQNDKVQREIKESAAKIGTEQPTHHLNA
jgi:hypothetical protein